MVARTPNKAKKKRVAGPAKPKAKAKSKAKTKTKAKAKSAHGPKANRQVKSYMFATIFGELKNLIALINALLGTNYGPDTPAEIATLKNVLSTGPLNDLAIILNDTLLVLVEHRELLLTYRAAKRRLCFRFCDAEAAHVYGGRYGGDLSPRRVGSGIKTGIFLPVFMERGRAQPSP